MNLKGMPPPPDISGRLADRAARQIASENRTLAARCKALERRVRDLENELAAARTQRMDLRVRISRAQGRVVTLEDIARNNSRGDVGALAESVLTAAIRIQADLEGG